MKTVLCYGDSNTWGYIPGGGRHPWNVRWTGRLALLLGNDYRIIEEGLNGRTTGVEDPMLAGRNGYEYFPLVLETHFAADVVVLMLGTNDLKSRFQRTVEEITQSVRQLILVIQSYYPETTAIVLIAPPAVQTSQDEEMNEMFEGAEEKCPALIASYQYLAQQYDCYFIDAGEYCSTSIVDGIHLDESNHQALARAVYEQVMQTEFC